MRVQKAFLDATEALGWAYHHNTTPPSLPFEAGAKIADVISKGKFEWVEEVHIREKIKGQLPKSSLFALKRIEIAAIFQAQPQLCHCCHGEACEVHVAEGVELLYKMWDARIGTFREGKGPRPHPSRCSKSVCYAPSECVARDNVEEWIQLQDAETLAHLLEVIWIASQLYDYTGMKAKDFRGCEHAVDQTPTSHTAGHSNFTDPTRSLNERDHQWDRVEMECIFREMCFESGPAFLYACRPPAKGDTKRDEEKHQWAIQLMQRGVQRLHAYEAGELVYEEEPGLMVAPTPAGIDGHAGGSNTSTSTLPGITLQSTPITHYVPRKTLQATLLQRFCHLQQCDLRMGWDEVFHVNAVAIDKIRSRMEEERERVEKEEERKLEEEKLRLAWSSAMTPEGGWEVKPTLLEATDVSQEHDTGVDCAVGTVDDWFGDALRKEGWMPGSFNGSGNGEEVGFGPFTANGEQQARRDTFNTFVGGSSRDGANLSFKFKGLGNIDTVMKRTSAHPPICDGEGHAEDGSCVLDELLWDVGDTEKWDRTDEFVGNNLGVSNNFAGPAENDMGNGKDKGKGKAVG